MPGPGGRRSAARARSARRRRIVLGPDARAVRLGEPARDREPEPGAAGVGPSPRWNGSKTTSRSSAETPGPSSRTWTSSSSPSALDVQADRRVGRRELQRVVEQVDEHALDLDRRRRAPAARRRRARSTTRSPREPELLERARDEIVDRPELGPRRRRRRSASRERSSRLPTSRFRRSASTRIVVDESSWSACVEPDLRIREARRRSDDRRQRRAEVVRDRMQERRLQRVAPPERLGLELGGREGPVDSTASSDASAGRNRCAASWSSACSEADEHRPDPPAACSFEGIGGLARRSGDDADLDPRVRNAEHTRREHADPLELVGELGSRQQVLGHPAPVASRSRSSASSARRARSPRGRSRPLRSRGRRRARPSSRRRSAGTCASAAGRTS